MVKRAERLLGLALRKEFLRAITRAKLVEGLLTSGGAPRTLGEPAPNHNHQSPTASGSLPSC